MMSLELIGPVGIRTFVLEEKCQEGEMHKHNYDHTMIVIRGRIRVKYSYEVDGERTEGESREFSQGEELVIKADVIHAVKALEPNTIYKCILSHRDFDGLVSQTYLPGAPWR